MFLVQLYAFVLFIMAKSKNATIEKLRSILDEKLDQKLMPLKDKIQI